MPSPEMLEQKVLALDQDFDFDGIGKIAGKLESIL
jgi:hypothetical protein